MAKYLDLEGSLTVTLVDGQMLDVVTDYMGIAEMAGFDTLYINNLKVFVTICCAFFGNAAPFFLV
ncbi:hypothetical protein DPMN_075893 [Dreissena polymorpha]|uniref:Uncharacterized protein n=1 Tax=Dreissena polymorpha TaxID=45954 RepID=A0A9D3YHP7_DREPO|nr:hypothetical protein DPMN_075893 [Dreissena polymorpha]